MRTTFPQENEQHGATDTALTQEKAVSEPEPMKYPVKVKLRGVVVVRIYKPSKHYPLYRVAWMATGTRQLKAWPSYSAAKRHADAIKKDLAKGGGQLSQLTAGQAVDARGGIDRLKRFFQETGQRVSITEAINQFCESAGKLPRGRTLGDAVDGFLSSIVSVKRKDLAKAVDDFIAAEEPRTKAGEGKRSQLSAKYAYNRAIMLRRFAATFPNTGVSELGKDHLDLFIGGLAKMKSKSRNGKPVTSAKSRNHHRAAINQFLQWSVRKDYLSATHRLGEADAMRPERANDGETLFYTPNEFEALLEAAEGSMRAMVAIGGLAGLRTSELLSLDWTDVWRVENHIEITSGKSKTRQRRLVEICPALAAWLKQFSNFKQGRVCEWNEITWQQHFVKLCEKARVEVKGEKLPVTRKPNGLRHAFCTYHFAAHGNENLTAMQAGNSPAMIHQHYKGLATKKEAERWFAASPAEAENVIHLEAKK